MKNFNIILSILILIMTLSCGSSKQDVKNDLKFNSKKWKLADMRTKGRMTDHIIQDSILIGKSKSQVLELLGEPDMKSKSRYHYTIDIGIEYMSGPWTYWMSVDFDTIEYKVRSVWLAD